MSKRIVKVKKKDKRKNVMDGVAHIIASFNNTIVTITDALGDTLSWSSAGHCEFRGSRKSTQHAAKVAAENAGAKAKELGLINLKIKINGPGPGRELAAKALASMFKVTELIDVTPVPHNGCRPPNERRV